jgi:hypothetical protein
MLEKLGLFLLGLMLGAVLGMVMVSLLIVNSRDDHHPRS